MTNEFSYINYNEYVDLGGKLSLGSFRGYAFLASSTIDYYTFDRLRKADLCEQPLRTQVAVKECMMALIKVLQAKDDAAGIGVEDSDTGVKNVKSESNDGVSVEYNVIDASYVESTYKYKIDAILTRYLQGCLDLNNRKLLYRGLYPDE